MHIERFVSKLLGPPQRVDARLPAPTYRDRWIIADGTRLKIYLDHYVSGNWRHDLVDYPKTFISIGIAECIEEDTRDKREIVFGDAAWILLISRPSQSH